MDAPRKEQRPRVRRYPTTLALMVAEYVRVGRPRSEMSWRWHSGAGSLREAIRRAAIAARADGQVEEYQRGIPARSRWELGGRIAQLPVGRAGSFAQLHDLVKLAAATVPGLDSGRIYETAFRLGAYLRLRPDYVYLHPRARAGAWALWITSSTARIARPAYPVELRVLRSWEVTEFLDLNRGELAKLRSAGNRDARLGRPTG